VIAAILASEWSLGATAIVVLSSRDRMVIATDSRQVAKHAPNGRQPDANEI
jgi:hypothetical protein